MSRRARPGAHSEYSIRWHSFADITTPSLDIMSSPDPLNDSAGEAIIVPSSAHRATRSVTRSLRSDRYLGRDTSPRKQTFELEVGDNRAPQKLLVTVETEGASVNAPEGGTRRKLFQSSSPMPTMRQRERATTTTVPLKDSIEEEPMDIHATPRRRGRPRKSNGTPVPGAGVKRRAGTPIRRTPRRPRMSTSTELEEGSEFAQPALQLDPRSSPKRRGRPPKSLTSELHDGLAQLEPQLDPQATPKRRGRPPKNLTAERSDGLAQPETQPTPKSARRGRPPKNRNVEPSSELDIESGRGITARTRERRQRAPASENLNLIELANEDVEPPANMDDDDALEENEVTLVIAPSETGTSEVPIDLPAEPASDADSDIWMATLGDEPTPRATNQMVQTLPASSSPEPDAASQGGDYGYLAPAGSDVSSADEPLSEARPGDTIAQGEDFSMIFMDSLHSIQELRSSVRVPAEEEEYGEETNLIINNTLESLRQSLQQRDEPSTNLSVETPAQPPLTFIEPASAELKQPSIRPPMAFSPNGNLSPRWLRSPRRGGSVSPLRHQVLKFKAKQTDGNMSNVEMNREEQRASSPMQRNSPGNFTQDDSNLYDDSFSEIPQDVLEAATPQRPRAGLQSTLPVEEDPMEPESVDDQVMEEAPLEEDFVKEQEQTSEEQPDGQPMDDEILGEPLEQQLAEQDVEEQLMEEQIVEEELVDEAPVDEALVEDEPLDDDQEMEDEQPREQPEAQYPPPTASTMSVVSRSDAGRLPTPDDTPPQIEVEADDQGKSTQTSQASVGVVSPKTSSPLAVSARRSQIVPEIVEEMVDDDDDNDDDDDDEEEEEEEEEVPENSVPEASKLSLDNHLRRPEVTPVNQLTSPLQDPQSLAPETTQEKISRPLLSPIVRAGRALQSVTSDPPSPEPREHQLRSPFRSSVTRELGPPTHDLLQLNRRISLSPKRPSSFPPTNQTAPATEAIDDPFVSNRRYTGQMSFMEALERSSGNVASQRTHESPRESRASSMRITPPNDEVMSWVADEGPISANLRGDVPLKDFARPTTAEMAKGSASQEEVDDDVEDANDGVDDATEERDDESDIWEFEAKRATPRTARQQPFGNGRRNLPNTWMRQSTHGPPRNPSIISGGEELAAADGAASDSDMTEDADVEEYSLLTQKQAAKEPQVPSESAKKASRFDLAAFFSSPAAIPGMLAEKFLPAKTASVFGARPREPEVIEAAPVEVEAVLPTSSMFPQVAQKEFRPRSSSRNDLFSPSRNKEQEQEQEQEQREGTRTSSTHDALDETDMPSVAQKQNFTPRPKPKQPVASFFRSSTRSAATTPPRMQLSHADIQRWQHETSVASEESPEVSRPFLRPLPPKHASPYKSSLRSPLKPHTPGRVVEFTSSVLSPVEQAKARQTRRLSNSSASQASIASQRPSSQRAGKENHAVSDASMSEASPVAKVPQPAPLSQTVWTRQHWLYLDELLQLRRAGPYELNYERRADRFLGKTVRSYGESMILERWHLDCVDAFKASVGGWDEASLAKRLFALILGEERRSHSVAGTPARVMFH